MNKQVRLRNLSIPALHLFFLFLLCSSSLISARLLETKPGQEKRLDEIKDRRGFLVDSKGSDFTDELLGLEEYCDKGDDECMKRRIIAEAHLDYIYTQHHKP